MTASLDVRGEVEIATPAGRSVLSGRGNRVFLDAESFAAGRALLRHPFAARRAARARLLGRLRSGLERGALTFVVRFGGRPVLEIGRGVRPGWLARLTGFGGARLRPLHLLAAWRAG